MLRIRYAISGTDHALYCYALGMQFPVPTVHIRYAFATMQFPVFTVRMTPRFPVLTVRMALPG